MHKILESVMYIALKDVWDNWMRGTFGYNTTAKTRLIK